MKKFRVTVQENITTVYEVVISDANQIAELDKLHERLRRADGGNFEELDALHTIYGDICEALEESIPEAINNGTFQETGRDVAYINLETL